MLKISDHQLAKDTGRLYDLLDLAEQLAQDLDVSMLEDAIMGFNDALKLDDASCDCRDCIRDGNNIPDAENVINRIAEAHDEYLNVRDMLKDFDKTLAKLIAARGKLAEDWSIPMFSHIPAHKRSPNRETYDV